MVEVSNLYNLDIYTITGHFVGQVADVVLNIRLGTISKLQVKAIEHEKNKQVGIRDFMRKSLQFTEEEQEIRTFKNDLLTIDFDKVQAIGDIILINPRDIKAVREAPTQPISPQESKVPKAPVKPSNSFMNKEE